MCFGRALKLRRTACVVDKKPPPSSDRETVLQYRTPRQGGAVILNGGDSWDDPGAIITIRNSTFLENSALLDSGGAIYVGKYAEAHFEGDTNNFTKNVCELDGGVLAASTNSLVTVEGGLFNSNEAGEAR